MKPEARQLEEEILELGYFEIRDLPAHLAPKRVSLDWPGTRDKCLPFHFGEE